MRTTQDNTRAPSTSTEPAAPTSTQIISPTPSALQQENLPDSHLLGSTEAREFRNTAQTMQTKWLRNGGEFTMPSGLVGTISFDHKPVDPAAMVKP